jgi:serine/threonine protein kinase
MLGEGGFGCAWLVKDSDQGNKQLVLKEIRCDSMHVANQAIEESSTMLSLQHPQLVCSQLLEP